MVTPTSGLLQTAYTYTSKPHSAAQRGVECMPQEFIKIYNLHIAASIQEFSSSVYIKYSSPKRLLFLKQPSGIFQGEG